MDYFEEKKIPYCTCTKAPKIQLGHVLRKIGRQHIILHPKISQNQLRKKVDPISCLDQWRGEGGGLPFPFSKIGKKCPNFENKCLDSGHLWVKFLI